MPLLKIQTNTNIESGHRQLLMERVSEHLAKLLGKPESYIMVALEQGLPMLFGGSAEPLAYLELKSIGLPGERTGEISAALCQLVSEELGIDQQRIYIEFSDAARHMWGWNGATF